MTRFVVDSGTVLRLVETSAVVPGVHELLAPTVLRSQTLSTLHEAVHVGSLSPEAGRDRLDRVGRLPIRLFGDAVLRRTAWAMAEQLGWASTYDAEYLALATLRGIALVTTDATLASAVEGVVETAPYEALLAP
ncbi:type II toxin-antitoxin system VapC family toxin [Oerskovia turbata]